MKHVATLSAIALLAMMAGCDGSANQETKPDASNGNPPTTSGSTNTNSNGSSVASHKKVGGSSQTPLNQVKTETTFTLAVIPDTQKYAQKYPEIFDTQTQWIAENYKQENIKFTVHLGDIVETPNSDVEWRRAVNAMKRLDENPETPYSILAGNHDILGIGLGDYFGLGHLEYDNVRDPKKERFLKYFSVEKQRKNFATFKGADVTGLNSYHIFSDDDGQQYLVFATDWRTSDQTIAWIKSVLKAHANLPAILTTHEFLDPRTDSPLPKLTPNGLNMWVKLVKDSDQIFLTLNGHWNGEGWRVEKNDCGRDVLMIVTDYQNEYKGGNGMMQLINFDKARNRFEARSYSPYVAKIKFEHKAEEDILERWNFSVPMDFEERFSNFKTQCNQ